MTVGFIGAGKVGFTLGRYFTEKGVAVLGYSSRTRESAAEAARFTGSRAFDTPEQLAESCDTVFLTVPDGAIAEVWQSLKPLNTAKKNIVHCSGSLPSSILEGAASACSLHPLFAVHDRLESWKAMSGVYFTLDGHGSAMPDMEALLDRLGNRWSGIDPGQKNLYHAACVTVSNLVVGLAKVGSDMFAECGLGDDFSKNAWHTLFRGSVNAICDAGVVRALTGPVERADSGTVRAHLAALDGRTLEIYRALSEIVADVAQEKNPDRDYTSVRKELSL